MLLAAAVLLPRLVTNPTPDAVTAGTPGVQYRANIATASGKPWVTANGWRLERDPVHPFFYDAPGNIAALAAAEAFAYGREAEVHTDAAGKPSFDRMIEFLKTLEPEPATVIANIGVIDDGSSQMGEVMNLLARHNLLYRIEKAPDPLLAVNLEKPKTSNPDLFAQKVRQQVTDGKRVLRIYGSDVVLARLTGDADRIRLHLINYGDRPVHGLRVRVLGLYPKSRFAAFDLPGAKLQDYEVQKDATEFTVQEMRTYAVVDLVSK